MIKFDYNNFFFQSRRRVNSTFIIIIRISTSTSRTTIPFAFLIIVSTFSLSLLVRQTDLTTFEKWITKSLKYFEYFFTRNDAHDSMNEHEKAAGFRWSEHNNFQEFLYPMNEMRRRRPRTHDTNERQERLLSINPPNTSQLVFFMLVWFSNDWFLFLDMANVFSTQFEYAFKTFFTTSFVSAKHLSWQYVRATLHANPFTSWIYHRFEKTETEGRLWTLLNVFRLECRRFGGEIIIRPRSKELFAMRTWSRWNDENDVYMQQFVVRQLPNSHEIALKLLLCRWWTGKVITVIAIYIFTLTVLFVIKIVSVKPEIYWCHWQCKILWGSSLRNCTTFLSNENTNSKQTAHSMAKVLRSYNLYVHSRAKWNFSHFFLFVMKFEKWKIIMWYMNFDCWSFIFQIKLF